MNPGVFKGPRDSVYTEKYLQHIMNYAQNWLSRNWWRLVLPFFILAVIVTFAIDVIVSYTKLRHIEFTVTAAEEIIANGSNKYPIKIAVREKGKVRSGDMVQAFLVEGGGKLLPSYFFTDEEGQAETWFTPTAFSRYSPTSAELAIEIITVGKIIEVKKKKRIFMKLLEEDQKGEE